MSEVAMLQDLRFLSKEANLPCFENVLSQVIKHLYRSEKCTYSDLEQQLADDFKIGNNFHKEDLNEKISEFKNEIYWVCKYLKLIQFIQFDPERPLYISSKGMDFLSRCPPEESQLKDLPC